MKAAELMVGDWVCLKDDIKCELPLKVDGVLTDDISLEGEGFLGGAEGLIRPIPLTPEILEKNGFVFDCVFWTIANPRYNNVRMVTYYSIDDDVADAFLGHWAFDENYAIDYVHELQHALRLCGLNELADNFKA